jgi:hypothetical protein
MTSRRSTLRLVPTIALLAALGLAACDSTPRPPEQPGAAVARLEAALPLIEQLGVTDFEDSPFCRNLGYQRGDFGHLGEAGCARPGTVEFDAVALEDHARVGGALEASGVPTLRVTATFGGDGRLATASFVLLDASTQVDWAYLHDPGDVIPKGAGGAEFAGLGGGWWLVRSLDD